LASLEWGFLKVSGFTRLLSLLNDYLTFRGSILSLNTALVRGEFRDLALLKGLSDYLFDKSSIVTTFSGSAENSAGKLNIGSVSSELRIFSSKVVFLEGAGNGESSDKLAEIRSDSRVDFQSGSKDSHEIARVHSFCSLDSAFQEFNVNFVGFNVNEFLRLGQSGKRQKGSTKREDISLVLIVAQLFIFAGKNLVRVPRP